MGRWQLPVRPIPGLKNELRCADWGRSVSLLVYMPAVSSINLLSLGLCSVWLGMIVFSFSFLSHSGVSSIVSCCNGRAVWCAWLIGEDASFCMGDLVYGASLSGSRFGCLVEDKVVHVSVATGLVWGVCFNPSYVFDMPDCCESQCWVRCLGCVLCLRQPCCLSLFGCVVHSVKTCFLFFWHTHFIFLCRLAMSSACFLGLFVICHHPLWADLDCLLACSSSWSRLPLVQGLCLLQWLYHWRSSNIHSWAPSSWVVFCLPYMWVFHKDWMRWAWPFLWPWFSRPAPTLINRCSSNIHFQAHLRACGVFRAPHTKKRKHIYIYIYIYKIFLSILHQ